VISAPCFAATARSPERAMRKLGKFPIPFKRAQPAAVESKNDQPQLAALGGFGLGLCPNLGPCIAQPNRAVEHEAARL
jgi:hypothetical protein